MAFPTTLAACSLTPSLNGPQGTDPPSDLDDSIRQVFALIAQLRDGAGTPVGAIVQMPTATAPTGFLKLNGALVSRTTYAALFAFATSAGLVSEAAWSGGSYGCFSVGDGSTTFRLPDLRAMHLRGLDESRGIDTGRVLGVFQDSAVLSHTHGVTDPTHNHGYSDFGHTHSAGSDVQGAHAHTYQSAVNGPFTAGGAVQVAQAGAAATSVDGAHGHNITVNAAAVGIVIAGNPTGISIQAAGFTESRVKNVAYPYYIKF